ncbi:MAG: hypothetical protein HY814_04780 [Candidatus Riflebacteria bacterium]|nr:hypothetical protein [Candidatus Riflebacteria bacterium]
MQSPALSGSVSTVRDLAEELRLSALSGLRWRLFVGLALVFIFAGSHPHAELLSEGSLGVPACLALPVIGFVTLGEHLATLGLWPLAAAIVGYGLVERLCLCRLSRGPLLACGRVVVVISTAFALALNVPLVLVLASF